MPAEIHEIWSVATELEDPDEGPEYPPAIRVSTILRGTESGSELCLRDRSREIAVCVLGRSFRIARPVAIGGEPMILSLEDAVDLARVCAAWRAERIRWATYEGHGEWLRHHGYSALRLYRPGRWKPLTLKEGDPRIPALRERARRYDLTAPAPGASLGGFAIAHALQSGLGEPVGLVVRGPGSRCAILLRSVLWISDRWPSPAERFTELARGLIRGIWKGAPSDRPLRLNIWSVAVVEQAAQLVAPGGLR